MPSVPPGSSLVADVAERLIPLLVLDAEIYDARD